MSNYISKFKSPYQEVFSTSPINQQFIDQSGNGNNVTYKNVQIGNFNGTSDYVITTYSDSINKNITIYANLIYSVSVIFSFGSAGARFFMNNNVFIVGAATSTLISTTPYMGTLHKYSIITDGDGNPIEFFIDDISLWTGVATGGGNAPLSIGARDSGTFGLFCEMQVSYFSIVDELNYDFQDGDDSTIIDTSGNGNDAEFIGGILSDFRGTYIDGIDSVNINNGYSRFQQIADPTKFINAAYTDAGIPTHTSVAGYEAPIEIPKNVISDNNITYSGILNSGISETDATFSDIDGIVIIPESDLRVTLEDGVFTDWAVQPYANYQVLEGDFETTDGVYPVIKDF